MISIFQFKDHCKLSVTKLPIMHYDNKTPCLASSTPDCNCNVYEIDEK